MVKIYYDKDADLKFLKGKKIAIVGYGIQGRAQAMCLRDSGMSVTVCDLKGTANWKQAEKDGFKPLSAAEASGGADLISVLTEDVVQPKVYGEEIKPGLKKGKTILFSHGFNIHYNQIVPDGYRRDHGGPEGPGKPGQADVRGRQRRSLPSCGLPGFDG